MNYSSVVQHIPSFKISRGVLVLIFFICPLFSIPFIVKECYNRRKYAYILASLMMGICAMLLKMPTADQYRHMISYYQLTGGSWGDFMTASAIGGKFDFLLYSLEYYNSQLNLPFGFIKALLTFLSSLFFLRIYDNITAEFNHYSTQTRKVIFWTLFFAFPMEAICSGMRYGFAMSVFCYVFSRWYLFNKRSILDLFLLVIAVLMHSGSLMILLVWIVSLFMPDRMSKTLYVLSLCVCFCLSISFATIIDYLPLSPDLYSYVKYNYIEGEYTSIDYVTNGMNILGLLNVYVGLYVVFGVIMYISLKRIEYNKQTKLLFALILFWALTINLFAINGRVLSVIQIIGCFSVLAITKYKRILFITFLSVWCFTSVLKWRTYPLLHWQYLLAPMPVSIQGNYDQEWINKNVDSDGNLLIY